MKLHVGNCCCMGTDTFFNYMCLLQGVGGALTVLMKDTILPNLMQTLEVCFFFL